MTEGRALLDPAMSLQRNSNNNNIKEGSAAFTTTQGNINSHSSSDPAMITAPYASVINAPPSQLEPPPEIIATNAIANLALTPSSIVKPTIVAPVTANANNQGNSVVRSIFSEESNSFNNNMKFTTATAPIIETTTAQHHNSKDHDTILFSKLLSESNVMTIQMPTSLIRVGKTWSDSSEGNVEAIMNVFNLTTPNITVNGDGGSSSNKINGEAIASIELNCIILGAKLIITNSK
jgi:hypothetical protein